MFVVPYKHYLIPWVVDVDHCYVSMFRAKRPKRVCMQRVNELKNEIKNDELDRELFLAHFSKEDKIKVQKHEKAFVRWSQHCLFRPYNKIKIKWLDVLKTSKRSRRFMSGVRYLASMLYRGHVDQHNYCFIGSDNVFFELLIIIALHNQDKKRYRVNDMKYAFDTKPIDNIVLVHSKYETTECMSLYVKKMLARFDIKVNHVHSYKRTKDVKLDCIFDVVASFQPKAHHCKYFKVFMREKSYNDVSYHIAWSEPSQWLNDPKVNQEDIIPNKQIMKEYGSYILVKKSNPVEFAYAYNDKGVQRVFPSQTTLYPLYRFEYLRLVRKHCVKDKKNKQPEKAGWWFWYKEYKEINF